MTTEPTMKIHVNADSTQVEIPDSVTIDETEVKVQIGPEATIGEDSRIIGSKIGGGVKIGRGSYIKESTLEDNTYLESEVTLVKCFVESGATIGTLASLVDCKVKRGVEVPPEWEVIGYTLNKDPNSTTPIPVLKSPATNLA